MNLKAGECIKVKGKVEPEAKSFALNVGRDSTHLMLHFNPRFEYLGDTRTIVYNSMAGGEWGEELRESQFPFQEGEEANICVSFDAKEVRVKLHGGLEIKFPNRLGLESVDFVSIEGDFFPLSVKFD